MAMHQPGARVVGGEGEDQVAARRQGGHVAARGVGEGEAGRRAVPDAGAGLEDVEVVAVEVDGVGNGDGGVVLDPPVVPLWQSCR